MKKLPRIFHSMNFEFIPEFHCEYVDPKLPSQTVPNQSLSIRQIYDRYRRERPLPVVGQPFFTGDDPEMNYDFDRMSIQERLDLKRDLDDYVDRTTTDIKAAKAAAEAAAKEAERLELQELREFKKESGKKDKIE